MTSMQRRLGPLRLVCLGMVTLVAGCAAMAPSRTPQQYELAELYMAAEHGHPEAQFRLGQIYGRGSHGVVRDYAVALRWLSRAAAAGHGPAQEAYQRWTSGEAARELTVAALAAYENGDTARALPLLRVLAEAGVADAAYLIGRHGLSEVADAEGDRQNAVRWLQSAADQGHANAQYLLGTLAARGEAGMAKSDAVGYWTSCAEQRHAMCQYGIGLLQVSGEGTAVDRTRGLALIRRSAAQGYDKALDWLARWRSRCREAPGTVGCVIYGTAH